RGSRRRHRAQPHARPATESVADVGRSSGVDNSRVEGTDVPERLRLLARARGTAFAVLLMVIGATVVIAWAASVVVVFMVDQRSGGDRGTVVLWLAAVQLPVLAALAVVARGLARRSTRF